MDAPAAKPRDSLRSLFLRFLRFGALAWGGPAAQISMISRECVDEEGWVSDETFAATLAVYQVLPGPEAHELCVYFGRLRRGRLGGLVAGLGFMLPGLVLMLGLSILYVEAGLSDRFEEIFYGLQAAVGALVAMAIVRLGRKFIRDAPLAVIAAASFALTVTGLLSFALVLLLGGVAYLLWRRRSTVAAGGMVLGAWPGPLIVALPAAVVLPLGVEIFAEGLLAGLLTFGGAYTVVPFLQGSAVETHGWLTQAQFLDGLALSGVLPAPMIIFSTFVGYIAGGLAGGLLMTFGIFLPAFVLPIFFHGPLVALAENVTLRPLLLGVAAAVVGLIGAVTIQLLEVGVTDVPSAILAALAFAALYRFKGKLAVLFVVTGCGAAGAALQFTIV